jgi:multisubunit Na+/H+ antiporter MnhG subunit
VWDKGELTMQTKSQINQLFVFLYFVGIGLLVAGFLILVPDAQQTHTAWLDLAVVCIVYSANFPLLYLGRWRTKDFNTRISALGLLGVCDLLYSVLALGGVFVGWYFGMHFRSQLIGQAFLIFAAVVVVTTGRYSSAHVDEVTDEEDTTRAGLENLKRALDRCEAAMRLGVQPANRELQLLLALKDDARYLSPSVAQDALSCEQKIVAEVEGIRELIAGGATSPPGVLDTRFQQCAALMALRKQVLN